jgi:ATP-dependent Lon protease
LLSPKKSLSLLRVANENQRPARLLELPVCVMTDAVLFPKTLLPVRLESPSNNRLIQEVLSGRRLVVVALFQPDAEPHNPMPVVYRTAGLGTITDFHEEDDEGCQLLIKGHRRCLILDLVRQNSMEIAKVRLLPESRLPVKGERHMSEALIRFFLEVAEPVLPPGSGVNLLHSLDFATLVNSICSCLNIPVYAKQELLEAKNLQERSEKLLSLLKQQMDRKRFISDFTHLKPADPSLN